MKTEDDDAAKSAILNLHAQAVAVQNIWTLVPVVLDLAADNYAR